MEGEKEGAIRTHLGRVTSYVDAESLVASHPHHWSPPGFYTDDTQQALICLEVALSRGRFVPGEAARIFVAMASADTGLEFGAWRGIGPNFKKILRFLQEGKPWEETRVLTAGNGAAMRIGPLAAFYADRSEQEFVSAMLDCSVMTHGDPIGVGAALALAGIVRESLNGLKGSRRDLISSASEWAEKGEGALFQRWPDIRLEVLTSHHHAMSDTLKGLSQRCDEPEERVFQWLAEEASALTGTHITRPTVGLATASVSLALFIATEEGLGLFDKLVKAVNMGGDSDTVGAMVGTLAGVLHGASSLPQDLLKGLANKAQIAGRAEWLATGRRPSGLKDLVTMEIDLTRAGEEMRQAKVRRHPKKSEAHEKPRSHETPTMPQPVLLKGPPSKEDKRRRREFERNKSRELRRRHE